ncbi:MAG: chemotaxis-specific protein-glutamate methyltransferase CheB, partial [Nitrospirae bacterium]|nr:chemotaxis-specific protein-glutamate methyltransferase CheB [Nitrospirota bacterium]
EMDGFSFLRLLMKERPTPVIMVSSHADSKTVFKALQLGAVDFIAKPTRRASIELQTIEKDLVRIIGGIKNIRLDILNKNLELLEGEKIGEPSESGKKQHAKDVVAIGSSTGGPAALQIILTRLPFDFQAAIVISQHMPRGFTGPLAERLDRLSQLKIKEAEEGEQLKKGTAYVCPGGYHLGLSVRNQKLVISLKEGILTDKYTPSVDYMMTSVAEHYGASSMGVILTGMGNDGRNGMLEIKEKGGYTIAEAESSAVVFGMPAEAIKNGAVETVLPISDIPSEMIRVVNKPHTSVS